MMNDKIEIPLSKVKITFILTGAVIFIGLSIFLIIRPELLLSSLFSNKSILRIIGIAAVIYFGSYPIFIARKLFDKKAGLTIDENGIMDNSGYTSVGIIEWQDITGIRRVKAASNKILVIQTDVPDKYIGRAKYFISKRAMKENLKSYGSPLVITSKALKIKFNELENLIKTEFEKRK